MSRRVSRRTVLIAAAPLVFGSLLLIESVRGRAFLSLEWVAGRVRTPARRLRAHFPYLTLDDADLERFVADHAREDYRLSNLRPWKSDVYLRFLASTDFFANGADESRPVKYVGFQKRGFPCGNPFATFD